MYYNMGHHAILMQNYPLSVWSSSQLSWTKSFQIRSCRFISTVVCRVLVLGQVPYIKNLTFVAGAHQWMAILSCYSLPANFMVWAIIILQYSTTRWWQFMLVSNGLINELTVTGESVIRRPLSQMSFTPFDACINSLWFLHPSWPGLYTLLLWGIAGLYHCYMVRKGGWTSGAGPASDLTGFWCLLGIPGRKSTKIDEGSISCQLLSIQDTTRDTCPAVQHSSLPAGHMHDVHPVLQSRI